MVRKICAMMLIVAIVCNLMPISALSLSCEDETYAKTSVNEIDSEYLLEMEQLGFTREDVLALSDWSKRIANADSMQEVDSLMREYNALVEGTVSAVANTGNSFYTSTGGTLVMEYTGTVNPISQVIYDKIVFLPADQVMTYYRALSSEGFLDYLKDEVLSAGIGFITKGVAKMIADYLKVSASSLNWMLGISVGIIVWILQNLDKWDFERAYNDCILEERKVKIEFYHLQSIYSPYYQDYKNCEPWNSSLVEPITDYNYVWYADIYDYDSDAIHYHEPVYTYIGNGTHSISCNTCTDVANDSCSWTYEKNGDGTHSVMCKYCNYEMNEACRLEYTNITNTRHSVSCTECDYYIASQACQLNYRAKDGKTHTVSCTKCENRRTQNCGAVITYTGSGQHNITCHLCEYDKTENCSLLHTYCGDGSQSHTHNTACAVCGNQSQTGTACTFVYRSYGDNTHSYLCSLCGYVKIDHAACLFDASNICRICGAPKNGAVINKQEEITPE